MNSSSPVCRTCLGIISDGKTFYNIDDENGIVKNVRNIRDMLTFCVPEMDIFISVSPSICETCLGTLVGVYNFKIRCLRVENAIRSYIVANNVMEGSCVDLSNVVKLQITEALRQKNWPQDVIRDYISRVDTCLKVSRKSNPVPPGTFSAMSRNFNRPLAGGTVYGNAMPPPSQPNVIPVPRHVLQSSLMPAQLANTTYSPNNLPENNPVLNQLLNTFHEASKDTQVPLSQSYISVSKNLMPPKPQQPLFSQLSPEINRPNPNSNLLHSVGLTPNLSRPELSNYPVVHHTFPTIENIQKGLLNSVNNGDRAEAILVTSQAKTRAVSRKKTTKNETHTELCPVMGTIHEAKSAERRQTVLKGARSYTGPKSKTKAKSTGTDDTVVIDDDDDERRKVGDEVLIMNFDEDANIGAERGLILRELLKPSGNEDVSTKTTTTKSSQPEVVVKLPQIDKETMKRKLSPENIIDEILSKRKKLIVNLHPSLPYLHTNKKLIVKVQKDTFCKCSLCSFATLRTGDLEVHYQSCHRLCKLCDYKCNKKPSLDEHIASQHILNLKDAIKFYEGDKAEFHCYLCQFVGLSIFDLRDHRLRVHIKCNESGFYKCPFASCDKEDAIAYSILRHTEGKHDIPRRKECPLCNHKASSHRGLKIHVQSHIIAKKVTCSLCPSTFKTTFQLQRHRAMKHPDHSQEGYKSGMVYGPTSGSYGNLTTDEDGRIILTKPTSATQQLDTPINVDRNESSLGLVSLSEMFCTQLLEEVPEQEDDCTIVNDTPGPGDKQAYKQQRVILNKHNKKSQKRVNDFEDCVIVSDDQQGIRTVDLSDDDNTPASKRTKMNGSDADVIEIIDEEPSEAGPPPNVCLSEPPRVEATGGNNNGTESAIVDNAEGGGKEVRSELNETSSQLLEKLLDEHFSESSLSREANSPIDETSCAAASSENISLNISDDGRTEVVEDTSSTSPNKLNDDDNATNTATAETNSPSDKARNVSDTQDSDDNIIVSDSESEKSAVIQKRLDVELTGKSPNKFAKYPSDIFQTDSEVEMDSNERASSSISGPNDEDFSREVVTLHGFDEGNGQKTKVDDPENHQKDTEGEHNSKNHDTNEKLNVVMEDIELRVASNTPLFTSQTPTVESSSNDLLENNNSQSAQELTENDIITVDTRQGIDPRVLEESELENGETLRSTTDAKSTNIDKAEINNVVAIIAETPSGSQSSSNDLVCSDNSTSAQEHPENDIIIDDTRQNIEPSPLEQSELVNGETLHNTTDTNSTNMDEAEINNVAAVAAETPSGSQSSSNDLVCSINSTSIQEQNEMEHDENDLETDDTRQDLRPKEQNESVNNETLGTATDCSSTNRESDTDNDAAAVATSNPVLIQSQSGTPTESSSNDPVDNNSKSAQGRNEEERPKTDSETHHNRESESVTSETLSSTIVTNSADRGGSDMGNDAETVAAWKPVPIQPQSDDPTKGSSNDSEHNNSKSAQELPQQPKAGQESELVNSEILSSERDTNSTNRGGSIHSRSDGPTKSSSKDSEDNDSESVKERNEKERPETDSETHNNILDVWPREEGESMNSETLSSTTDTNSTNRGVSDIDNDTEALAALKSLPIQPQSDGPTTSSSNDSEDNNSKSAQELPQQPKVGQESELVNSETLSSTIGTSSINRGESDVDETAATSEPVPV